jgi:hypothetical protein
MSRLDEARTLILNKMCVHARNNRPCDHRACAEANLALADLDAGQFSERAETVLTNRLCKAARSGESCGHPTCADIQKILASS